MRETKRLDFLEAGVGAAVAVGSRVIASNATILRLLTHLQCTTEGTK